MVPNSLISIPYNKLDIIESIIYRPDLLQIILEKAMIVIGPSLITGSVTFLKLTKSDQLKVMPINLPNPLGHYLIRIDQDNWNYEVEILEYPTNCDCIIVLITRDITCTIFRCKIGEKNNKRIFYQ